jgi:hypothetical protein
MANVGQQMNSSLYHKIIYFPNRIFPLVQNQLAKYLKKWMNSKSCNISLKHNRSLIFHSELNQDSSKKIQHLILIIT